MKIDPEPPLSQEPTNNNSQQWLDDVLHTVNNSTINIIHNSSPPLPPTTPPHPLQDSDFCRITSCQCSTYCTSHFQYKEPTQKPTTIPEPTAEPTDDNFEPDTTITHSNNTSYNKNPT